MEQSAVALLKQAVEVDTAGERLEEAATLYREGCNMLLKAMKTEPDASKKVRMRTKIEEYINRAEELKKLAQDQKEAKKHEQIHIANNSLGHSYEKIFGRFIDETLTSVEVEDPYIRSIHQIYNFLRFCELLVKKKSSLKKILLITSMDDNASNQEGQIQRLEMVRQSLRNYQVDLIVQFSSTLHDREIRFDSGWVIKIGRGLDIYKPSESKFSLGYCDYDLRPCHETTVDIFHRKFVKGGAEAASQ